MRRRLVILVGLLGMYATAVAGTAFARDVSVGTLCKVTPFQSATTRVVVPGITDLVSVEPGSVGAVRVRVVVPMAARPTRLQFLSVRWNNGNDTLTVINSVQVTTVLSGRAVKHGIELPPLWPGQFTTQRESDVSREYTLYADASSAVSFDVELWFDTSVLTTSGGGGELTVTTVGQNTDVGCGFGG